MNRIRKSKAFTLIELIVVVIIIGVLAGIAAVAYNQFVANSRDNATVASAKQLTTAINAAVASKGAAVTVTAAGTTVTVDGTAITVKGTPSATATQVKILDGSSKACASIPASATETSVVVTGAACV